MITESELGRLVAWVTETTGSDLFAEEAAASLLEQADLATTTVLEISDTKTVSGNPETFRINPTEIRWDRILRDVDPEDLGPGEAEMAAECRARLTGMPMAVHGRHM